MAKREFVMLAHPYKSHSLASRFLSEKLDGQRAIWDGGITRGLPASEVPFANKDKDDRYVNELMATGLWSRYGKPIQAPDYFLDSLPDICMDGELWISRDSFQELCSTIKTLTPGPGWKDVKFMAFNTPHVPYWLSNGRIYNNNMDIQLKGARDWAAQRAKDLGIRTLKASQPFINALKILNQYPENKHYRVHEQVQLPACSISAKKEAIRLFNKFVAEGAEGVMLADANSHWMPERSHYLVKMKGKEDSEAKVIGYVFGTETDKGSKLLGMIGSLIVEWNGKVFNLSGLTDSERNFMSPAIREYAENHPGEEAPDWVDSPVFPKGSMVTFTYRSLTDVGIPKEARYLRRFE